MRKLLSLIAVICISAMGLVAQPQFEPLPIDANVRIGVLDNGLTYYIRFNQEPKERCEFHIAQAVGASLEEDHQDGLAHFLEHMAFNGTDNLPGKTIINYMESVGVNFGGNINAYTSIDETVYRLSNVPTIREGILDTALLVMHDWSCAISLHGEEIDNERGVIREEWRTGNSAGRRMWNETNKQAYAGTKYAIRDVIGDTAVINNFDHQALRDYYHLWYGPDLQAIVIVGDIDVDKMERKLIDLFSKVPERKTRGVRPVFPLPINEEPITTFYADKEAQYSMLGVNYKHPQLPREASLSYYGYLRMLINDIMSKVFSYRFGEMAHVPNCNFMQARGNYDNLVGVTDALQFMLIPKDGKEKEAAYDLYTFIEKVKRYGFTATELERAKVDVLAEYEGYYNSRGSRASDSYAGELYRNYLSNEPIPGIEWEYEFVKSALAQIINPETVNPLVQSYITDNNVILTCAGKDAEGINLPSKEDMLNLYAAAKEADIEAPIEETFDMPLVSVVPKAGKIKKEKYDEALGTTELTLSNGVTVIIKQTDFNNDQILISLTSEGGLSKVAVEDIPSAMLATDIQSYNGLGELSALDLNKAMTGKKFSVEPSINNYSESIKGHSTVKDFESMLQATYLMFATPRRDDVAYETMMSQYNSFFSTREADSKTAFKDTVSMVTTQYHPRTVIVNLDLLAKVDQQRALDIYAERFNNIADFRVVLVGNIDPKDEAVRNLICTWIGGLKTTKARETFVDNNIRYPKGEVKNYFTQDMKIHTATNRIVYSGSMEYTLANQLNMSVIGDILSSRYLESIREREGGSYGVGCYGFTTDTPIEQAYLLMQFDTDPEKQERLMEIIHEEVETIIAEGPLAVDLQKVKESMLKDYSENIRKNNSWVDAINIYKEDGINYAKDYVDAVNAVTAETVQATLKALIEQNNVIEVVMSPAE
ncbi:MAG: insulinase family protein [bacterium]